MSPFFAVEIKGLRDHQVNKRIFALSRHEPYSKHIPYILHRGHLELQPEWRTYFQRHQAILRGFIQWHLVKFLQKNNPNVIGLTEKLTKPVERDLKLARKFWRGYLSRHQTRCIYSNALLTPKNYSLDHFIPWSYIAHDQLWNIIPTLKKVNSAKCDRLPSLKNHLGAFCQLQYDAYHYHLQQGHPAFV